MTNRDTPGSPGAPAPRVTVTVDPSFAALADLLYGDGYADSLAAALTGHLHAATTLTTTTEEPPA